MALADAIYSALTDDVATTNYFLEDQETDPLVMLKTKPLTDLWVSGSWA